MGCLIGPGPVGCPVCGGIYTGGKVANGSYVGAGYDVGCLIGPGPVGCPVCG